MDKQGLSRRTFLRGTAVGSTTAALASLPLGRAAAVEAPPAPPYPVTVESFPLTTTDTSARQVHLKFVASYDFPNKYKEKIKAYAPNLELKITSSAEEFRREIADAHIIFLKEGGPRFQREDFLAAKQVRWVQAGGTGMEGTLFPELVEGPVVLTNTARTQSPTISETAIGMLLALARRINDYVLLTHEHRWNHDLSGFTDISGLTMGIVGMGGIGTDTAYRAHYGFHMRILGVDPKPLPKPVFVAELHSPDWLPQMVPQVDVLMSAAPHTPVSHHMFNDAVFRLMKPSAFFINMSRGGLVDTPALISALKDHRIAGAGLDVTETEPLPADDPLWSAGNLIITSHASSISQGTDQRKMELLCENIRRYMNGLPLLNVVDKKRGY
jgi:phosphoglycerate dehydrogenase-like enzyme